MKENLRWIVALVYVDAVVSVFASLCGYPLPQMIWTNATFMMMGAVSGLCKDVTA